MTPCCYVMNRRLCKHTAEPKRQALEPEVYPSYVWSSDCQALTESGMHMCYMLNGLRLGRRESLTVMLEILRQQHHKERVLPAMAQHQRDLLQLKAAHQTACAAVATANELAVRQAQRLHAVAVQQVQQDNQRRVRSS